MIFRWLGEHRSEWSDAALSRLCAALGVSRSGFYDWRRRGESDPSVRPDAALRAEMHGIVEEFAGYGYRRVRHTLRRAGHRISGKRTLRLMREEALLCRRKRRPRTTDSSHGLPVYPNEAKRMQVTDIDQLWRTDITSIPTQGGDRYLSAVIDDYSRKCLGWTLSDRRTCEALALPALEQAFAARGFSPSNGPAVHHSDRGSQYASEAYTSCLRDHQTTISMSGVGNPYDNAKMESFFKTLKAEEVHLFEYETEREARERIGRFIESYNRKRLHSALEYQSPDEFERSLRPSP